MAGAIAGFAQVISQEYPHLGCRLVDLEESGNREQGIGNRAVGVALAGANKLY